ncbi:MAG: hypothetical protein QMC94_05775 [Anaerosomatales bacterium]|nr:hypothetical protein [Anaerosomatales bacterium]
MRGKWLSSVLVVCCLVGAVSAAVGIRACAVADMKAKASGYLGAGLKDVPAVVPWGLDGYLTWVSGSGILQRLDSRGRPIDEWRIDDALPIMATSEATKSCGLVMARNLSAASPRLGIYRVCAGKESPDLLCTIDENPDAVRAEMYLASDGSKFAVFLSDLSEGEVRHDTARSSFAVYSRDGSILIKIDLPEGETLETGATDAMINRLAVVTRDKKTDRFSVRLYEGSTKLAQRDYTFVSAMAFSPDGSMLAVGGELDGEGGVEVLKSARELERLASIRMPAVSQLAFDATGEYLVAYGLMGTRTLVDGSDISHEYRSVLRVLRTNGTVVATRDHAGAAPWVVVMQPFGSTILMFEYDGEPSSEVLLLQVSKNGLVDRQHRGRFSYLCATRDGRSVVAVSRNGSVRALEP